MVKLVLMGRLLLSFQIPLSAQLVKRTFNSRLQWFVVRFIALASIAINWTTKEHNSTLQYNVPMYHGALYSIVECQSVWTTQLGARVELENWQIEQTLVHSTYIVMQCNAMHCINVPQWCTVSMYQDVLYNIPPGCGKKSI